jgi:hypothetical protein
LPEEGKEVFHGFELVANLGFHFIQGHVEEWKTGIGE